MAASRHSSGIDQQSASLGRNNQCGITLPNIDRGEFENMPAELGLCGYKGNQQSTDSGTRQQTPAARQNHAADKRQQGSRSKPGARQSDAHLGSSYAAQPVDGRGNSLQRNASDGSRKRRCRVREKSEDDREYAA